MVYDLSIVCHLLFHVNALSLVLVVCSAAQLFLISGFNNNLVYFSSLAVFLYYKRGKTRQPSLNPKWYLPIRRIVFVSAKLILLNQKYLDKQTLCT